jgi:hypothetical protein
MNEIKELTAGRKKIGLIGPMSRMSPIGPMHAFSKFSQFATDYNALQRITTDYNGLFLKNRPSSRVKKNPNAFDPQIV